MLLKLQLKQVPSVIYFAVSVSQFDNITTGYMLHFVIKYKSLGFLQWPTPQHKSHIEWTNKAQSHTNKETALSLSLKSQQ
jgi:hypothetical protein